MNQERANLVAQDYKCKAQKSLYVTFPGESIWIDCEKSDIDRICGLNKLTAFEVSLTDAPKAEVKEEKVVVEPPVEEKEPKKKIKK